MNEFNLLSILLILFMNYFLQLKEDLMNIPRNLTKYLATTLLFTSTLSVATPITSVDFYSLNLGAMISGPVGPEVEVSLLNPDGNSLGDLRSSVSCPEGFATCIPADNDAGTIYTYVHTIIPGVDNPNDAPFLNPATILPFDDVAGFSLGFEAIGFNGIAGFGFSDASTAGISFDIDLNIDNELVWSTDSDGWDTGEEITFFWQTTQAPSGPTGVYNVSNNLDSASGIGPLPTPLAVSVSEPFGLGLFLMGLFAIKSRKFTSLKSKFPPS